MADYRLVDLSFSTYFDGAKWYTEVVDDDGEELAGAWGDSPTDAINEVLEYLRDEGMIDGD